MSVVGQPEVVCVGETMALLAPDPPVALAKARVLTLSHGGAESNVAVSLARLGTSAWWCGRLGDDALGWRVRAELEAFGVGTALVKHDPAAPTGVYFKDPSPGSTGVWYYRTGSAASRMDRRDFERAIAVRPRLLHVSGVTPALSASCRDATRAGIVAAQRAGIVVSFDVNHRPALWPDVADAARELKEIARMCEIVFVGADEAAMLWGTASVDQVATGLAGPRTLAVVVKDGSGPATSVGPAGAASAPALSVEVVEPVGAGDAFAAGWLRGYLIDMTSTARLRLGHLVAAETLRSPADHARDWPPPAELEARARAGERAASLSAADQGGGSSVAGASSGATGTPLSAGAPRTAGAGSFGFGTP